MSVVEFFFKLECQMRLQHWTTKSQARHKASCQAIADILASMDSIIEKLIGHLSRDDLFDDTMTLKLQVYKDASILRYIDASMDFLKSWDHNSKIAKMSDILNLRDELLGNLAQFKLDYKPGSIFPQTTETKEEKIVKTYIEVKPSRLAKAGLGAFAAADIPADTSLGPYRGLVLDRKMQDEIYPDDDAEQVLEIYPDDDAEEVLEMTSHRQPFFVDAASTDKNESNWTRQINDPQNTNLKANVILEKDGYFRTLCKIPKGCELYFNYGTNYWPEKEVIEIQQLQQPECDCAQ